MTAIETLRRAAQILHPAQLRRTDLLRSHRTAVIHLEFTSKCNLRCTFCAVSQPNYRGRHLDAGCVEQAISGILERRPDVVTVNGHGETTVYRDWHLYCDRLLDAGIPLHIISNFGRPFSEKELATLSRFQDIEISCDSHVPETFALLRRGAELPTLLDNIERLRDTALADGRQPPALSFSCVVSDVNVLSLPEYVDFVDGLGVRFVNFCNLTKYPELPGVVNPNHVTAMPADEQPRALTALEEAFRRLEEAGIEYRYQEGLLDTLRESVGAGPLPPPRAQPAESAPPPADSLPQAPPQAGTAARAPEPEGDAAAAGAVPGPEPAAVPAAEPDRKRGAGAGFKRYTTAGRRAMTRDCLDPWKFLLIQANRDVLPCCWHRPIHSLGTHQPLSQVFNTTRLQRLRLGLLEGELPDDCLTCPARGWAPVAEVRRKVWSYLNDGRPFLGVPWAMRMVPERLAPVAIEYGDGWYPPETNPQAADPARRAWRWSEGRADCRIASGGGEGVLSLHLGVDLGRCPTQEVTVALDGREIDRFKPPQADCQREYAVGPELTAGRDELSLVLTAEPTFVPAEVEPGSGDRRELGLQLFELTYARRG